MRIPDIEGLPVYPHLGSIADALVSSPSRFLALTAETAAGKSTAVPLALLERLPGKVLMLEPRRIAALACATRMSTLIGEEVGRAVGYRFRHESRVSAETRLEVMTEGVLVRALQRDPSLAGVSAVILDEFHERSIPGDLALAFLREIVPLRDDLFVLVMSATMDASRLADSLGCAVYAVPGRTWPVSIEHDPPPDSRAFTIPSWAARAARSAALGGKGDVLVFLPGIGEIRSAARELAGADAEILVLHGSVPIEEQRRCLSGGGGRPRIILSSAIAETSLTVPGVTTVVDSGLARLARFDPRVGMERLVTENESEFSAAQRAGRAGRMGPGRAIRLWSPGDPRPRSVPPAIQRSDLVPLVLECALWGARKRQDVAWLDEPPEAAWEHARELLALLGALDGDGAPTERGKTMATLGVHPRVAAVALTGRIDLAVRASGDEEGSREAVRTGQSLRSRLAGRSLPDAATVPDAIALLAGYPDRIARHRGDGVYQFPSGRLASLPKADSSSRARQPDWIVAVDVDAGEREGRVWAYETVGNDMAEEWLAERAIESVEASFDGTTVRKSLVRRYGRLELSNRRLDPEPGDFATAYARFVRDRGLAILPWDEASRSFLARARLYHRLRGSPETASDDGLLRDLDDWLVPFLPMGGAARAGLSATTLLDALRYRLDGQAVDREVPLRIGLPSGVSRPLSYEEIDPAEGIVPVLETRVQDLFGLADTPRICGIPVLIRLLSPARRPLQITRDLAGFWRNTWPEVVKEMKGRYPKHRWPVDPTKPGV